MENALKFSHKVLEDIITKDDICVDMTLGNGNDTFFLAKLSKKVYAFDIQEQAIINSKIKNKDYDNIVYILDSHENILSYVNEEVKAVMFNLGYLPNGDKSITTSSSTTLKALEASLKVLKKNGRVVICLYPGHSEGLKEANELEKYLKTLDQHKYDVLKYQFINQINNPPFLMVLEKKK